VGPPGPTTPFYVFDFTCALFKKVPLGRVVGHFCSRLIPILRIEQIHCAFGESFLIGGLRV
jgi:hypothetical protein